MRKKYTIFYKGEQFSSDFRSSLVSALVKQKGLSENDATSYVNSFIRNTESKPSEYSAPKSRRKGKSLQEVVNGALALVKVTSGDTVDQGEINRRATICTNCKEQSRASGCSSCGFAGKVARFVNKFKKSISHGFTVPNGLDASYCNICDCSLVVMLPSKMSSFRETDEMNKSRPDNCWIKKTSSNYVA